MEIIETLIDSVNRVLNDEETSVKVVRQLTKDFGGGQVYIPLEKFAFKEEFEKEVYERFDGCNIRELSKEFNISRNTVRRIIADERKRRSKANEGVQPFLF